MEKKTNKQNKTKTWNEMKKMVMTIMLITMTMVDGGDEEKENIDNINK